jgi:quinol monooxygenase YgiN
LWHWQELPKIVTLRAMWAQLIRVQVKPGKDLDEIAKQLQAHEQPGSGLVRSTLMRDQKDPSQAYMLVVFESEDKARAREQDPKRQAGMDGVRALMADAYDGAPQFTDLVVEHEWTGS